MELCVPSLPAVSRSANRHSGFDVSPSRHCRKAECAALLAGAWKKIGTISELDQLLEVVLTECLRIAQCESGALHLMDRFDRDVVFIVDTGAHGDTLRRIGQRMAEDMAAEVATIHEPRVINTMAAVLSDDPRLEREGQLGPVVCVPVLTHSGLVGALCVADRTTTEGVDSDELEGLSVAVDSMVLAIEGMYRHQQMCALGRELESAQEQAERLAVTIEQMGDEAQLVPGVPPTGSVMEAHGLGAIIGRHPKMECIYELIISVARTDMTVCITGESGTGKSLIAREIHKRSGRRDGPFVEVSCGVLSDSLLQSELFGHVRGSFTGAIGDQPGKFELAHSGTIFLDEIATASTMMQVKLLTVLQERRIERIGGSESIPVNVRVIVAANADLDEMVEKSEFRRDLFYRINVVPLEVPPLRERVEDIPMLVERMLEEFPKRYGLTVRGIMPQAIETLQAHPWHGNVRELENVIQRALVLARGGYVTEQTLSFLDDEATDFEPEPQDGVESCELPNAGHVALKQALEGPERAIIRQTLEASDWNRNVTARVLEINRTTLYNKMRKYGLLDAG